MDLEQVQVEQALNDYRSSGHCHYTCKKDNQAAAEFLMEHRLKVTTRASHADEEAVLSELEKNAAYYLVHYGDLSWAGA